MLSRSLAPYLDLCGRRGSSSEPVCGHSLHWELGPHDQSGMSRGVVRSRIQTAWPRFTRMCMLVCWFHLSRPVLIFSLWVHFVQLPALPANLSHARCQVIFVESKLRNCKWENDVYIYISMLKNLLQQRSKSMKNPAKNTRSKKNKKYPLFFHDYIHTMRVKLVNEALWGIVELLSQMNYIEIFVINNAALAPRTSIPIYVRVGTKSVRIATRKDISQS